MHEKQLHGKYNIMNEAKTDELKPEYDFQNLSGAVRGKYAEKYRAGVNIVRLDADVASRFPTEKSVNDALRQLITIANQTVTFQKQQEAKPWPIPLTS